MGAVSSDGMAPTRTVGSSASIIFPCSTKIKKIFMMACNNIFGFNPVGAPTCLRKPQLGKLRKGWSFRVGTWNINSLTGRSGELVEALAERRMDVACAQETRWRGSGCRFFGAAIGKRYKLFWMGSKAKTDGVGISTTIYYHLTASSPGNLGKPVPEK